MKTLLVVAALALGSASIFVQFYMYEVQYIGFGGGNPGLLMVLSD
jgi:hypothetical protein